MTELMRRKLFIGWFMDQEYLDITRGLTISRCLSDTDNYDRDMIMELLECDGYDIERWIEAGSRFVI